MVFLDTFNILHASARSPLGRLTVADLRELIPRSRWRSDQVVLVMDGTGGRSPDHTLRRGPDAGADLSRDRAGISEVYARSGGSSADADLVIEQLLEREEALGRGRQAMVVSSDRRVRAAATAARAQALASEEFLRQLADDMRKSLDRGRAEADGGRPEFALDGGMDAGRTAYWLKQFGLDPSGRGAAAAKTTPGECGQDPSPDDVDMDAILKAKPKPRRD